VPLAARAPELLSKSNAIAVFVVRKLPPAVLRQKLDFNIFQKCPKESLDPV
jgi:hypothetical protein